MAFWGFIAAWVVASIWNKVRKREAEHETLRRAIESGQPIGKDVIDQLAALSAGEPKGKKMDRDLTIGGVILLSSALGLALFGLSIGAVMPLLGIGLLVGCIGAGLLVAARVIRRWNQEDGRAQERGE